MRVHICVCVCERTRVWREEIERERFVRLQCQSLKIKHFSTQLIQSRDAAVLITAVVQPVSYPTANATKIPAIFSQTKEVVT